MDFLVRHWAPFPRRFPSPYPLVTADFLPAKATWIRAAFHTCNFSLILQGRGEYWHKGQLWPVQAPCVITQWPDVYVEYGPPSEETWSEFYLVYDARVMRKFQQAGLVDLQRPAWPIRNLPAVLAQIEELRVLSKSAAPEDAADKIDRIAERLILETLAAPAAASDKIFRDILAEVSGQLDQPIDFSRIAARHGMSDSTFRRRWMEAVATPPSRYLLQLRLRKACRLLAETTNSVRAIAHAVGFEDEFYFSRCFRAAMRTAPRDYRKTFRVEANPARPKTAPR